MKDPTTEQVDEELSFREAILPPQLRELRQKLSQKAKQPNPAVNAHDQETLARAGCGKSACPVRRGGGHVAVIGFGLSSRTSLPTLHIVSQGLSRRSAAKADRDGDEGKVTGGPGSLMSRPMHPLRRLRRTTQTAIVCPEFRASCP